MGRRQMNPHFDIKEAMLCSFFEFIFYSRLLLEWVYMLWCSRKSSVFSYSQLQQPCFFQGFCLCLRSSVLAPAPPPKAYPALIGQFKHTPSGWTYREAQHCDTLVVWDVKKSDENRAFRAIRNSPQGLQLHTLTSLFHTLASFKTAIQLCHIIYRLKETEKHNMTLFTLMENF